MEKHNIGKIVIQSKFDYKIERMNPLIGTKDFML